MGLALDGKIAFITGAGSGIGRAGAELFAAEGARVIIAEIDEALGEGVAGAIAKKGGDALFVQTDVRKPESVERAIAAAVQKHGRIDILYNNAGGSKPTDGLVHEITVEAWEASHSLDLFGTFLVCKYGLPRLMKAGGGAVVNTASYMALVGNPLMAYSAAKGGVVALTRCIASEYASYNIRANAICPCAVHTPRLDARLKTDPRIKALPEQHLLGLAEAGDIASVALFLASDASRRMTGAIVPVDSGITAR